MSAVHRRNSIASRKRRVGATIGILPSGVNLAREDGVVVLTPNINTGPANHASAVRAVLYQATHSRSPPPETSPTPLGCRARRRLTGVLKHSLRPRRSISKVVNEAEKTERFRAFVSKLMRFERLYVGDIERFQCDLPFA